LSLMLSFFATVSRQLFVRRVLSVFSAFVLTVATLPTTDYFLSFVELLSAWLVMSDCLPIVFCNLFVCTNAAAYIILFHLATFWGSRASVSLNLAQFCFLIAFLNSVLSYVAHLKRTREHLKAQTAYYQVVSAKMADSNVGLQRNFQVVEDRAREEERKRITRDIHDTLSYILTNIKMIMEAALRLNGSGDSRNLPALLAQGKEQSAQGLEKTREILHLLRKESVEPYHGIARIRRMLQFFESSTGVRVQADFASAEEDFDNKIEEALIYILQESLANSIRHGCATKVSIRIWTNEGFLYLLVSDNGTAEISISPGIGLASIEERVTSLGGTLWYDSKTGFHLSIRFRYGGSGDKRPHC
jgi:signal transduction histidine kinase